MTLFGCFGSRGASSTLCIGSGIRVPLSDSLGSVAVVRVLSFLGSVVVVILLTVGRPMITLYANGNSSIMNGTINVFDFGSSPIVTGRVIVPRGELEFHVNSVNAYVMGTRSLSVMPKFCKASRYKMSTEIPVFLVPRPKSDLRVAIASRSFFDCGWYVCLSSQGAITSRRGSAHDNINLFFNEPLQVGRGIPGGSTFGKWSLVSDIPTEVSLPNEVFDLVFEVMTFLHIMFVLSVEMIVFSFITSFGVCFD
ncbi:hypothetical protein BHM03_00061331 [Ensete ventricosum]|nr:hypothetical protein BHM03_00061331 [Ensete ventricosum]